MNHNDIVKKALKIQSGDMSCSCFASEMIGEIDRLKSIVNASDKEIARLKKHNNVLKRKIRKGLQNG